MTETRWFFPTTQGGEESGLNDPGIEFFRQSGSLARETLQNSGDASDTSGKPVTVTFELLELPLAQFPGAKRLLEVITHCRGYMLAPCKTERQKEENGRAWFEEAIKLLSGTHLPVLRIRDENTTGLEGDEGEEDKAWFRLIKKQGSASMHGAGGGTFGIGQRAPFAFSRLRTVFYSTLTSNGQHAFIGKTILSSFRENKRVFRPIGFWGVHSGDDQGVQAIREAKDIPEPFRRTTTGTDLYITGFDPEGWKNRVVDSVVCNFFAAILGGRLIVRLVDGSSTQAIDATTLQQAVETRWKEAMAGAPTRAAQKDVRDTLGATRHYLKALAVPANGEPFTATHPHLGQMRLYVSLDPDAPSRTAFMRRPRILVYERPQRVLDGYAAVFLCEDSKGNDLLARMEDPAHSKWDRERLPGDRSQKTPSGSRLLDAINLFIRESLEKLAARDPAVPQDLPDLGRYLPEDDTLQPGTNQTGKRIRTRQVVEEESARPQQAQGRKRATQRPRLRQRAQTVVLPVESGTEGELEARTPVVGGETLGATGPGTVPSGASLAGPESPPGQHGAGGEGRALPGGPGPFLGGLLQGGQAGSAQGTHGGLGSIPAATGQDGQVESGQSPAVGPGPLPGASSQVSPSGSGYGPTGPGTPAGTGSSGLRSLSQAQIAFRAWFSPEDKTTILVLRPTRRGRVNLRLLASGEDSDYKLEVASAVDTLTGDTFTCMEDRILHLTFEAGQRRELKLDLRPARRVALSIEVAHGA